MKNKIIDLLHTFYHDDNQDIEDTAEEILTLFQKELKRVKPKEIDRTTEWGDRKD